MSDTPTHCDECDPSFGCFAGTPCSKRPPDAQTPIWRCVSCGFEDTKPLREGVNNHWRKGYRPGKSPRSEDAICYAELKPVTDPTDAQTPPDWMDEARQIAAQYWCDTETAAKPMDPVLCEAVARRIVAWMRDAAQYARNAEYWRNQVEDLRRQLAEAEDDAREAREDASKAAKDAVRYANELAAERAIPRACRALEQDEVGAPCSYLRDAEQQRDAAITWIRMIGEECVLAGYKGGDRDVILANVRDMRFKVKAIPKYEAELRAQVAQAEPVEQFLRECEREADHIERNGKILREKFDDEHEGRCRELCATYLRGFISTYRMGQRLAALPLDGEHDRLAQRKGKWVPTKEQITMKRIEELSALPLPGVVASTPDEYERRRTAYIIQTAVNEALSDAAIQVFVVRQESEQEDADDKGTSGWLQDAEQRIRELLP